MSTHATAAGRQRRSNLHTWNALTRWILHVPLLRRLADAQVCELRTRGRRSDRPIVLPVMYAQSGDQLVILVGAPETKSWWRNFTRPHRVRVWLRGEERSGSGRVVAVGSPDREVAQRIYAEKYPDFPAQDDPLVVISLDPPR